MSTILLTGGRAPATLHLARLFYAAGHTVYVAECLPHHLCQASRAVKRSFDVPAPNTDAAGFVAALAAIVRDNGVELLIPTCEEVFHVVRGAAEIPCEIFAPAWPRLKRLHSKWDFIQDVRALGKPVPETWLVTSEAEVAAVLAARPAEQPLVIKPVFSRFAMEVIRLRAGDPPPVVGASAARPWVVQAFASGREVCSYGVARAGRLVAHTAYTPDFTANAAGVHFRPLVLPALEAWVRDLVEAWGLTGQVAFDLIEQPDGTLLPLECNPRATSGALLFRESDRLDQAFLAPHHPFIRPAADAGSMIGLAMWIYALPTAIAGGSDRLAAWARAVSETPDAIFRWDDPLPALHQFRAYGELVRRAGMEGGSPLAASTRDIEWNGER